MRIGDKNVEEILITNKNDDSLVATITDDDIIYENDYKVTLRENS